MGLARSSARGAAINMVAIVIRIGLNILVVTPIVARILGPESFGLAAMAMTPFAFFLLFGDIGLSAALVRSHNPSKMLWSTAFWATGILGTCVLLIAIGTAGALSSFYHEPAVAPLARALGIAMLFQVMMTIPVAWLQREHQLHHVAIADILSVTLAAIVSITAALLGAGVWALILQHITLAGTKFTTIFFFAKLPLSMNFRWAEIAPMMGFSTRLTSSSLVSYFNTQTDTILVGRYLGTDAVGLYSRAYQLMQLPVQVIAHGMAFAAYPAMARVTHDREWLSALYLKLITAVSFMVFPMTFGLAVAAEPLILVLLGPKWIEIAPTFAVLTITGMTQSFVVNGTDLLMADNRTDRILRWAIIRLVVLVPAFALGVYLGSVLWLALFFSVASIVLLVPFQMEINRRAGLGHRQMLARLLPSFVAALGMAAGVYVLKLWFYGLGLPALVALPVLVLAGGALYLGLLRLGAPAFLRDILGMADHFRKSRAS